VALDLRAIPAATLAELQRYVDQGFPPGDFLRCVLENNLMGAVALASAENEPAIVPLLRYIYNRCPIDCWGNATAVEAWIARGGSSGKHAQA
jgi:hypothetical protein